MLIRVAYDLRQAQRQTMIPAQQSTTSVWHFSAGVLRYPEILRCEKLAPEFANQQSRPWRLSRDCTRNGRTRVREIGAQRLGSAPQIGKHRDFGRERAMAVAACKEAAQFEIYQT